jgi:hypothetical protein
MEEILGSNIRYNSNISGYIRINSPPQGEKKMEPIILAALIAHYTSTTTATAKKPSFTVKADQTVCLSCTHAHTP